MSKNEFTKLIPEELREKIGLKRFKISLRKCLNTKQVKLSKMLLEFKSKEIFERTDLQNKDKATNYLKNSLQRFLLKENNIDLEYIDYKVEQQINVITIQDIMNNAIKTQEENFIEKMKLLSKQGVDTKIKRNNGQSVYKAILKDLTNHFGNNYDVNNLTMEKVKEYSKKFKSETYIKHLKAIWKRASNENDKIINWFGKLQTTPFQLYGNINKEIKIFYYDEIQNILSTSSEEEQYYFKTLLLSGMRGDELASIKKQNIKNKCFYFKDSKNYFNKLVPIHKDLQEYINNKLKTLTDDEYLFFPDCNKKSRVGLIRDKFNFKEEFKNISKTLYKTRATFITYLNFFKQKNDDGMDIKFLTHQVRSEDQTSYNAAKNISRLRRIIDSIDLEKLKEIEEQEK